jgi:hypothetical protein
MKINRSPSVREVRQFGALWLVVFSVVAFMMRRRGVAMPWPLIVWGATMIIGVIGLVFPPFMRRVYVAMRYATFPIGWVVGRAVLISGFLAIFLPVGLLLRLVGHDPMERRFAPERSSYWIRRTGRQRPGDYFRQF